MILLKSPIGKKNNYISYSENKFFLNLVDVKIKNIKKIKDTNDFSLQLYIPEENISTLKEIDNISLNTLLLNNNVWFNNDLEEDDLKELYRPSYCSQTNTLNVSLTENINYDIKINDEYKKIEDIIKIFKTDVSVFITIKLLFVGLYIYKTISINKWAIKTINIIKNEDENEKCLWERLQIEKEWKEHIEDFENEIDDRIIYLMELKNSVSELMDNIEKEEKIEEWENMCLKLKNIIYKKI